MLHEDGKPERVKSLVMANLAHPEQELGDDMEDLPLHITIVPPFWHDRIATGRIAHTIGATLADIDPFTVTAQEEALLPVNKDDGVFARKVGAHTLHVVHNLLIPVVKKISGVEIDTQFTGDNYTPHATNTETQRLERDDWRYIDALYLLQKIELSNSDPAWYVAAKYPLGEDDETAS